MFCENALAHWKKSDFRPNISNSLETVLIIEMNGSFAGFTSIFRVLFVYFLTYLVACLLVSLSENNFYFFCVKDCLRSCLPIQSTFSPQYLLHSLKLCSIRWMLTLLVSSMSKQIVDYEFHTQRYINICDFEATMHSNCFTVTYKNTIGKTAEYSKKREKSP